MTSSLDKVLEIGDDEFLFTLFDRDYGLPEAKEQLAKMIKDTVEKVEDCNRQYLEICAKLDLVRAGSESLSQIIRDST